MKRFYSTQISESSIAALTTLLRQDIVIGNAPQLVVDVGSGRVTAFSLSFRLKNASVPFLNISTDWVQTDLDNHHTFVASLDAKPHDIAFFDGRIGPSSTVFLALGEVETIEVIQSTYEVRNVDVSEQDKLEERVEFDRAITLYDSKGVVSLSTEAGSILGDIRIQKGAFRVSDDEDEVMTVRKTLE
ncbi:MAG: hypothetical protein JJ868_02925 [Shimia sp.]|uniref:hypothetical protein n=1 Tax=Shimia sp. TaxID=1954381 RepID=UPI001B29C5D0|nr:hypothetical protein [Shimia sp.]MBO6896305.1 hypothetical protein [Shimia sp.]